MSRTSSAIDCEAVEATWRNLEQQLDELLRLAATTPSAAEFNAALLSRAMQAVAARAAVLWTSPRGADSSVHAGTNQVSHPPPATWELDSLSGAVRDELFAGSEHGAAIHAAALQRRLTDNNGYPVGLDPSSGLRGDDWWSALAPVSVDGRIVAALEFLWPMAVPPAMLRNIANVLTAFAEAAAEFYRRGQLQDLRLRLGEGLALDGFALDLQRLADERAIWFTVANELGRFVDCDRVAVLTDSGGWRVRVVSHIDALDRRSPVVRSAERLAAAALHDAQPVWLHKTSLADSLPATLRWQNYLEESSTRSAALIPLMDSGSANRDAHSPVVVGALLIDRFAEQPFTADEQLRIEQLARHAAAALARATDLRRNSLLTKLWRKSTVVVVLLAASVGGAAFIPVDLEISARGELQPVARQDVFAPTDGLVRQLHVRDGQQVAAGTILLELTNDDLEFQVTRLTGELQTARQQLVTVQSARLDTAASAPARDQRGQLEAEAERLKQVIQGLEQQYQHLLRRRDELTVRSPIAGRIITANLDQVLRSRPLRRGQQLLTVADEHGPWVMELRVTDQDVGHVLAARQAGSPLPLRFVLATQPTVTHRGTVDQIADWTDFDESGEPGVRVTALIETPAGLAARPGATTTAKINCGRNRLGYVWLRDLIELVRTRILF